MKKVPRLACQFNNTDSVSFKEQDGKPSASIVAYSGKPIEDHWYWGNMIFSVQGMRFKNKIPLLLEHEIDWKLGFATKLKNDENQLEVLPQNVTFLENDYAKEFQENSKSGFPYEASMYIKPVKLKRLSEKEEEIVNGHTFKGPGVIWVESEVREVSVVTFGADKHTKSVALSEELELDFEEIKTSEETDNEKEDIALPITADQFKADNPQGYEDLVKTITEDVEAKFKADIDKRDEGLTQLTGRLDTLATRFEELDTENKSLKKENEISRAEKLEAKADKIFTGKLKGSNIPEAFHDKVSGYVNHLNFLNKAEDGEISLDETKFGEAVDAEIKDWETKLSAHTKINGGGGPRKTDSDSPAGGELEEAKKYAADLAKSIGAKVDDDFLTVN